MIYVSKISALTGEVNSMLLPITVERLDAWRRGGTLIQNAFPELSPDQREFLLTGATQAEWDAAFPPQDDEDDAAAGLTDLGGVA